VRLRRAGDRHVLTVKSAPGLVRVEEELEVAPEAFARLWPLTEGRRLEKGRHTVRLGGLVLEVDVYAGALAGLVVAEVEFPSPEAAARFEPPPWFGEDVSADHRYKNQSLALLGAPPA